MAPSIDGFQTRPLLVSRCSCFNVCQRRTRRLEAYPLEPLATGNHVFRV